jgi:hypothetical protein
VIRRSLKTGDVRSVAGHADETSLRRCACGRVRGSWSVVRGRSAPVVGWHRSTTARRRCERARPVRETWPRGATKVPPRCHARLPWRFRRNQRRTGRTCLQTLSRRCTGLNWRHTRSIPVSATTNKRLTGSTGQHARDSRGKTPLCWPISWQRWRSICRKAWPLVPLVTPGR